MTRQISEIFWMRAIACIGIVLIHSISLTIANNSDLVKNQWPTYVQLYLMFCTPLFVFITEFLNAHKYGDTLKKGFIRKRLLYLGVPYVLLNLFWTIDKYAPATLMELIDGFIMVSIRGHSVTYFILIIFQFYILHIIFSKYLRKLNPFAVILASIVLTSAYWGIRLIYPAPDHILGQLLWAKEGQTIFIGWITYFLLGYYIGIHYEAFKANIRKYGALIIALFIFSMFFVLMIHNFGINSAMGSKRLDTPIYTTAVILMIFLFSSYYNYVPKFIIHISNYSFGIYLLHLIFINDMGMMTDIVFWDITYKTILAICLSIFTAYLFNLNKYGKFFVGNVGKTRYDLPTPAPNINIDVDVGFKKDEIA